MFNGEKVLAVIPARGGSKRLPRKNILPLGGKPMIAWTIEAGLGSRVIDKVVVSTDSENIRGITLQWGIDDVIRRPESLATDNARSFDVIVHAVEATNKMDDEFGYVVVLQPTSPLRTAEHIDGAFEQFRKRGAVAVVGVCETEKPMEWAGKLGPNQSMNQFVQNGLLLKEDSNSRVASYQVNGAVYIISLLALYRERTLFPGVGTYAYVMKRECSVDIDTENDFRIAALFMAENGQK